MRLALLLAVVTTLSAATPSGAWQLVEGRVLRAASGEPVAGAQVTVHLAAPLAAIRLAEPVTVSSDAQGRFQLDLPRAMPGVAWDRVEAIMLVAGSDGLRARADRLRRPRLGRPLELRLEPHGADAVLATELRTKLDALRSASGNTIFVIADGAQGPGAETRDLVLAELGRAVRQHVSSFVLASPPPDITVQSLDLAALGIDGASPLGALAERLNALMVVGARSETITPPRGRPLPALASVVHLGMPLDGLPATFEFDESVVVEGAAAVAELERALVPRWARLAVMAWGIREYTAASRVNDVQRLRALQQLLIGELRGSGRGGGAEFASGLQALQRASEEAIRKLGPR